ncbi:hypothetical protein [Salipiger sp.]|uniref:hypothetical protein n=1 Tax=Salipiger sp. TaxID=2078585 RepID=UPI003A979299
MKQKAFIRAAGDAAVVWVRPASVSRQFGSKWPVGRARVRTLRRVLPQWGVDLLRPAIRRAEPFVIPAQFFGPKPRVTETHRFRLLEDLMAHEQDLRSSLWFRELSDDLASTGIASYKRRRLRSEAEIIAFLDSYMLGMIESFRTTGFDVSKSGFEPTAVIDAEGNLMKTGSGNHRFCIAVLLDLPRFPLLIVGAHEDWVRRHIAGRLTVEKFAAQLPEIEARHRRPGG